ncbi:MAG: phage portal protein [Ktedonobacteraceae bacterium]
MQYAPTLTQSQTLATAPIPRADQDRKRAMREAWKSYRGEFTPPLRVAKDQPDDNVLANFCGPIVDKGASWLFGQPVKIQCDDQDWLDGFWGDDDDKMSLLADAATNGGACGQSFLKLIPAQGRMRYPRIVVLDPQLVRIVTAPDDCSLTLAYAIEYVVGNEMEKRQVVARVDPDGLAGVAGEYALDDTWTITNYFRKGQAANWTQNDAPEVWPYPFAPIFCCKNLPNPNEAWGTPDLTPDLINQNKTLNFLLSNLARIIKFHGHPKTWAKGVGLSQINIGIDDLIVLGSPDAQLGTLTPMENFDGILKVVATIMSNIDQQSRVPAVALGRQDTLPRLGNISGVALSLMFQPLIEKTMQKRRLYGKLIREISRAALVLAGKLAIEDYEDYQIDLHWQPLLPADNLVSAQEALILQQLGVSQSTIFAGLGLDADDEADKKQTEDARALTNFSRGAGMPPAPPQAPQAAQVIAQDAQQQQHAGLGGNGQ